MLNFLYSEFCEKRFTQIFDIIVDFPESENAVRAMSLALEQSHKYVGLVEAIQSSLKKRLLVPGATTEIILQMYSSLLYLLIPFAILSLGGKSIRLLFHLFESNMEMD
jgi:hypothetical protein